MFDLLIEELESQRDARAQNYVSLVEATRKQENIEQEADREEREELYRRAFGASSRDSDEDTPDIILEEAANVLGDIIRSTTLD